MLYSQNTRESIISDLTSIRCFSKWMHINYVGDLMFKKDANETLEECINKKTTEEIVKEVIAYDKGPSCSDIVDKKGIKRMCKEAYELDKNIKFDKIAKEMETLKDSIQNTTDIVNLFTDIDKNRANLEDKMNKFDQKINKLEANMEQILNLLQKNDF